MAAKKRKQNITLRQQLIEEGYTFNFFKAVHLLELIEKGQKLGESFSPAHDPVPSNLDSVFRPVTLPRYPMAMRSINRCWQSISWG